MNQIEDYFMAKTPCTPTRRYSIPLTELSQTPLPVISNPKSMILVVAMEKFDELLQIVFLPDDMTVYANRVPVWKFTFRLWFISYQSSDYHIVVGLQRDNHEPRLAVVTMHGFAKLPESWSYIAHAMRQLYILIIRARHSDLYNIHALNSCKI